MLYRCEITWVFLSFISLLATLILIEWITETWMLQFCTASKLLMYYTFYKLVFYQKIFYKLVSLGFFVNKKIYIFTNRKDRQILQNASFIDAYFSSVSHWKMMIDRTQEEGQGHTPWMLGFKIKRSLVDSGDLLDFIQCVPNVTYQDCHTKMILTTASSSNCYKIR